MLLEICANSYQSALNAESAGAHRIELCSELSVGGLTPSHGLITKVISELNIKTFVLIRPRSGNFNYTNTEFEVMKRDIEFCKHIGCHGIVSGVLHNDLTLDIERTKELIEVSNPLPFTFHRAFDLVSDPINTLNQLIDIGVQRILTSGQQSNAIEGIELLTTLNHQAKDQITILAGSGIKAENAKHFKDIGLNEIHASASKIISNNSSNSFDEVLTVSSIEHITSILNVINA